VGAEQQVLGSLRACDETGSATVEKNENSTIVRVNKWFFLSNVKNLSPGETDRNKMKEPRSLPVAATNWEAQLATYIGNAETRFANQAAKLHTHLLSFIGTLSNA
jgi:hypothetical protein